LTDAVEVSPGRFFRQYSNVNITFDCGRTGQRGAIFTWLKHAAPSLRTSD